MNDEKTAARSVVAEPTELSGGEDPIHSSCATCQCSPDGRPFSGDTVENVSPPVGRSLIEIAKELPRKELTSYDVRYMPTGEIITIFCDEECEWRICEVQPEVKFSEPSFVLLGATKLSGAKRD